MLWAYTLPLAVEGSVAHPISKLPGIVSGTLDLLVSWLACFLACLLLGLTSFLSCLLLELACVLENKQEIVVN